MPRGRRKNAEKSEKNEYMCCGKGGNFVLCGLALILLGLLIKLGWGIADLLLLAGAIFVVKGLMIGMMKK